MGPRLRLGALAVSLCALTVVLQLLHLLDPHQLRDAVHQAGPLAPVVWVVVSALLGAALLPGPLLAAAGGLLLGTVVGTVTTVVSAVLSGLVSLEIGRRVGYAGAVEVLGDRARAVARVADTQGTWVVLVQRLAPGIPDAPVSYAFGALGIRRRDLAVGTALGTLPRAFSYTALGANLDDPTSPVAIAGLVGVVLSAAVGAVLGRRVWRDLKPSQGRTATAPSSPPPAR
jgi:uncharacterized membrane protein YdjX (TVP38/TMEM64 family)